MGNPTMLLEIETGDRVFIVIFISGASNKHEELADTTGSMVR